uniref:FCP1 homology domain-containing protein n=1 Tax=Haptolina ericina TaxID=156174 RepID=A0A7S3B824_9EUKA|mmetsp:Transcript_51362/g.115334  ORF Transcript_51362/g.115334 Transcript_51362/m.115334 type:complete len:190 (+) Transcript_51362:238-807(+)
MYMLWGGGGERIVCLKPWVRTLSDESKPSLMSAPFRVRADGDLDDRSGKRVSLLGDVRRVLYELKTETEWEGVVVAVASCTDEPAWARECMRKFEVGPVGSGTCLDDCMHIEEIAKGNKQGHLRRISDTTGVPLEEMIFFDNERGNCLDVAALGVTVAWVPEGVTAGAWEQSLERYPAPGEIFDFRMGG